MAHVVDRYSIHLRQRLGSGIIGTVYMATDENGSSVAAKEVDATRSERGAIRELENAFKQRQLDHDNIIKILHMHNEKETWLFLEFCEEGDLSQYASNHFADLQKNRLGLMTQMSNGLLFLHKSRIAHRDIKPGNILIQMSKSREVVIKLADFGLAKFHEKDSISSTMETNVGTQWYKAPEFWDASPEGTIHYHKSVDIYAMGLTFAAILQAIEGKCLKPKAVGCLQSEFMQPIGLAMFMRNTNDQPDLDVVEIEDADSNETILIKIAIQKATDFIPEERITAKEMLDLLHGEQKPNHSDTSDTASNASADDKVASLTSPAKSNTGNIFKDLEPLH